VRSRIANDISAGERTGATSAAMAAAPEAGGPEVAAGGGWESGGGCEVESAAVVGRPEELIEPGSDTKLVETTVLPGLGCRL
jgi:hypothetical protein